MSECVQGCPKACWHVQPERHLNAVLTCVSLLRQLENLIRWKTVLLTCLIAVLGCHPCDKSVMLTIWHSACCAEVPGSHVKHLERCMTDLLEYLTVVLACEMICELANWQDVWLPLVRPAAAC